MPEKEYVKAFKYDVVQKKVEEIAALSSENQDPNGPYPPLQVPDGMPGGALSISANGNQNGIVWVSMPRKADATAGVHYGSLYALDALSLKVLWSDQCTGYFAKFNPPTVADGHVFLATFADPNHNHPTRTDPNPPPDDKDFVTPGPNGTPCPADEPIFPLYPPDLSKPVGWSWIIEYGLK